MNIIIGCGPKKWDTPRPAAELYRSSYITNAVTWARSVTDAEHIWIFSAKYGVIPSMQIISPLEGSFASGGYAGNTLANQEQCVSTKTLSEQLASFCNPIILLAGQEYYRQMRIAAPHLTPQNPSTEMLPDKRCGYQTQLMKRYIGQIPANTDGAS